MFRFFRAACLAALGLAALFGAFYAGPSRAWEMESRSIGASAVPVSDALPGRVLPQARASQMADEEPAHPGPSDQPPPRRPLAELVADHSRAEPGDSDHECLAVAVYFEAKGESLQGQLAVAEVVLNRAESGRFPSTACGVVRQRSQFSFVRGGRFPPIPRASAAWRKAVAIAHIAREALAESTASRALFFHARYVAPGWRKLTRVATVGNHIFYR